jgi:phage shock protein C
MSAPFSAPRRLERSRDDRFIGGVCGGIAKYLNMDPTLVRILTVVITLFTFVPVVAYIIAMFVMPEEPADGDYPSVGTAGAQATYPTDQDNGRSHSDPVWGAAGAPWDPR